MIALETYLTALEASVRRKPNAGQRQAVEATKVASLFIVGGPGTGKIATLTTRMLKLIFVGSLSPRGILAAMFTRKAAQRFRPRLLGWGYAIQEHLLTKVKLNRNDRLWLGRDDIRQVRTGNVACVYEDLLREFRRPGTEPPIRLCRSFAWSRCRREGSVCCIRGIDIVWH